MLRLVDQEPDVEGKSLAVVDAKTGAAVASQIIPPVPTNFSFGATTRVDQVGTQQN